MLQAKTNDDILSTNEQILNKQLSKENVVVLDCDYMLRLRINIFLDMHYQFFN